MFLPFGGSYSGMQVYDMKTVLVTGNQGFLGRAVCRTFSQNGYCVVNEGDTLDVTKFGDLCAEYAFRDVDYIIHLAGRSEVSYGEANPRDAFEVNVAGTWNIMELAIQLRVSAVIIASTERLGIGKVEPQSIYETSKSCSESVAKAYFRSFGIPVAICRFGIIFGEGDSSHTRLIPSLCRALINDEYFVVKSPSNAHRKFIFVDDAVNALIFLIEESERHQLTYGHTVEVAYAEAYSISYVVRALVEASGKNHLLPKMTPRKKSTPTSGTVKNLSHFGWSPKFAMRDALFRTFRSYDQNDEV